MNVLPWLLDWPPGPAAIGVFLLVTALSVGTLVVFGGVTGEMTGGNVTVESTDLSVRLNDDASFPESGTGTVQTCLGVGTPGDSISVLGDVTLDVPAGPNRLPDQSRLVVAVSLVDVGETTTEPVEGTGRVTANVFLVLDDDETLSVGETATIRVRVRAEDSTVASTTRAVTVENGSRSYECDRSPGTYSQ